MTAPHLSAVEREISNTEALRVMGRALGFARPLWWRFAVKLLLAIVNLLPLLILPYPFKVLVDHVIVGVPIGEEVSPYPGFIEPWVYTLQGASRPEIAATLFVLGIGMILLIGGYGTRRATTANLAQGYDSATISENRANSASSQSGGLLGWIEFKWELALSQRLNHVYRTQLFDRISRLPLVHFDDQKIGDAVYRVMYDSASITTTCYRLLFTPILAPLHMLLASWLIFQSYSQVPILAYLPLVILPLSFLSTFFFAGPVRRRAESMRRQGATTTSTIEESISNILAVQSLGGQQRERERFDRDSWEAYTSVRRYVLLGLVVAVVGGLASSAVFLYVFYVITDQIIAGEFSAGDFGVVLGFYAQISGSVAAIASMWITLQDEVSALKRVFWLMDLPGEDDGQVSLDLPPIRHGVRLDGVSVEYPDGTRALDNISAAMRIGQVIGLVGPAGAGKTTLASVLPRFVEPCAGQVLIDGQDTSAVRRDSLRSQIAFVFQETVLLDASIEENLRLAKRDATQFEMRRACEVAGADEFIQALPQGYQTRLGRDGGALSVGQRQRLSIARALLRSAPILILDEPTSALDPETERRLVVALRAAARNSLVIVIAHRLSTVRFSDQILFIEQGRIRERGDHATLMAKPNGAYRRFVELQTVGVA